MPFSRRQTMLMAALSAVVGTGKAVGKPAPCCPIVELRQYTLHPGKRDTLIELFERAFIEPQEALGMSIVGTFRDLDNPDRFVWLRGFASTEARQPALAAFYGGPVWKANREAANATMIDSDNVLLLHPTDRSFTLDLSKRTPPGATDNARLLTATVYAFDKQVPPSFAMLFDGEIKPALASAGIDVLASFATEESPNNFPALPVRSDHVFVWFSAFADAAAHAASLAALQRSHRWTVIEQRLRMQLNAAPETLRLQPTTRSALR